MSHPITLPRVHQNGSALVGCVDKAAEASGIRGNRYLSALEGGSMSLGDFGASQRQFFFAVRYFPRPMAALTARMPDSCRRWGLVHNLAEEHGFDVGMGAEDGGDRRGCFDAALAHDRTFRAFLRTLEADFDDTHPEREGAAVRAFNVGLMGACLMEPVELAGACLGAIEYVFADISATIGAAVIARGWIPPGKLVHYALHAEIDRRHAAEFFSVLEPAWQAGGSSHAAVEDGVELGLHLFKQLYENLLRECAAPA